MPELPEVETVVRELDRKLVGKTVKRVEVLLPKIVSLGPGTVSNIRKNSKKIASLFVKKLIGQKVKLVKRRAKLVIFDFSGPLAMLVHLKMSGQFIYFRKLKLHKKIRVFNKKSAPMLSMPCKYTHVIFTFTDGSKLFFNDLRQFGYLKLVADKDLPRVKDLKDYGPEPLDSSFTLEKFQAIVQKRPNGKIKQVLMDPKIVVGIGNIYSDEILFHAGVRPMRKVSSIRYKVLSMIFKEIKRVLRKGIAAKGSSVGDFVRTDGSWGSMGKHHFVYGRAGQKCKVCGTLIKSEKFNGRTGSFCPKCQR